MAALSFVFFALGLNLAGVFEIGLGLTRMAGDAQHRLGRGRHSLALGVVERINDGRYIHVVSLALP